jgi:hypothetical protein
MKKIVMWKTDDGKAFKREWMAKRHEAKLRLREAFGGFPNMMVSQGDYFEDFYRWAREHWADLVLCFDKSLRGEVLVEGWGIGCEEATDEELREIEDKNEE